MGYPKITVVTTNLNQGNFLELTIQSVINQGYPNLEYIIIDGKSTDQSVEIIKKYETYLTYWESSKDEGMYHAINKGFGLSTGQIMTYLNSDDLLAPRSLFTIAQIFTDNETISWVNGFQNIIDELGRYILVGSIPAWSKYHYLLKQFKFIQQEGCFWRRDLWDKAGGYINTNYLYASDLELWSRFFVFQKLYYVPTILGSFRRRKGQKSEVYIAKYLEEAEKILLHFIPCTKEERRVVKNCNSLIWRFCCYINRRKVFIFFGLRNEYEIFFEPKNRLFQDQDTLNFLWR